MTLPELIADLDARGVRLSARLVADAPAGVLTPELRAALALYRPLLLRRVTRATAWDELSTWRWGRGEPDPTPGIVIDRRPDPEAIRRTLAAALAPGRDPDA